jgi:hypothetical protein
MADDAFVDAMVGTGGEPYVAVAKFPVQSNPPRARTRPRLIISAVPRAFHPGRRQGCAETCRAVGPCAQTTTAWLVTPAPVRARGRGRHGTCPAHMGSDRRAQRAVNLAGTCHPRPPIHSLGALLLSPHRRTRSRRAPRSRSTCCGPGDVDPFRLFRTGTRYFFSRGLPSLHASHTGA